LFSPSTCRCGSERIEQLLDILVGGLRQKERDLNKPLEKSVTELRAREPNRLLLRVLARKVR
jgi:hypothetical protein